MDPVKYLYQGVWRHGDYACTLECSRNIVTEKEKSHPIFKLRHFKTSPSNYYSFDYGTVGVLALQTEPKKFFSYYSTVYTQGSCYSLKSLKSPGI